MNRANLRCLGLSVGIAIALAGCRTDAEVEAAQRQQAYDNAYRHCINAVTGTFGSASFEVMKECQRQASAASGMSAGTAETQSGSGRQPASPARDSGDAQKEAP